MHRIVILICYYGKFPWYFKYFLHTCAYNPTIDFIIITDEHTPAQSQPKNVSIIRQSMEEFKNIASAQLALSVLFTDPYKINDFKPAYAALFPELIKGYDFWGHGDIDVIFGNIRNFMTEDILKTYDIISVRHDHITGFFTLFRNCEKINNLFKSSKDYKKVFSSERHFCFDETNFEYNCFAKDIPLENANTEIESMTEIIKKSHKQKLVNAYFDFHAMDILHGRLKWNKGTLIYKNRFEVMLYHLINLKRIYSPKKIKRISDTFYISPTRIYS